MGKLSKGVSISLGSFNCRGLGEYFKRADVFNWIKRKELDICIIVDTHCNKNLESKWKIEWGSEILFSSVDSNRRGVAVLFRKNLNYKLHSYKCILDNNAILLDISFGEMRFTLVGIYGPNSDSPEFFDILQEEVEVIGNTNVIIGGDFNVVLDYDIDTYRYKYYNNPKANKNLLEIINGSEYTDIWREINPNRKLFTWKGPQNKRSRLDYFLINESIKTLCINASIEPGYRSDHDLVTLEIELSDQVRGKGVWKFNNSLLYDREYVNLVKKVILETENLYRSEENANDVHPENLLFNISDQLFFETLKLQIRGATIPYCGRKKKLRIDRETSIEKEIKEIKNKPNLTEEDGNTLQELENELILIRETYVRGMAVRSKAKWINEGEKCSKFFCGLEKKHYNDKIMYKLISEENNEIYKTKDLINEQQKYFSKLYKKNNFTSREHESTFLDDDNPYLTKISQDEKDLCERPLTRAECLVYLKSMENGKSPGSDGFTSEFYKFFWNDLGHYLIRSFNNAIALGELSITQRHGMIILLPKEDKIKLYLKNWRPITLLNSDYKIFSGALSNRLQVILQRVISRIQNGFIKGRDISECTRFIYDTLHESKKQKLTGILLLLDFEKAFDSLDHGFIENSLKFYGFGPYFIKCINMLYKNITSCVLYNGHASSQFPVERGSRQGDPISSNIFTLCISTLAASALYNVYIKGITIKNSEYLMTQFADDATLILDGTEESMRSVFALLKKFESCSGLKVNIDKTKAVWIGDKIGEKSELCKDIKITWIKDYKFKILGIEYDLSKEDITENNYETKLKNIQSLLSTWSWRYLTLFGKLVVIKNLAIPQLVHLFRALPNPTENFFQKLNTICYNFIWNNKPDKIKRKIMISDFSEGGLKMVHLESFSKSLKMYWINKLLDNSILTEWKTLVSDALSTYGGNYILSYHPTSLNEISKNFNPFWQDIFQIWSSIYREPIHPQAEPLWFNPNIKIGGETVFYKNWFNAGVQCINDLLDNEGNFYSYENFIENYELNEHFLRFPSVLDAIPRDWKQNIKEKITVKYENIEMIKKNKKPNKRFYNILIEKVKEKPIELQEKWKLALNNYNFEISDFFELLHLQVKNTSLKNFQFKLLHRILPTNKLLYQMKIINYNSCHFCHTHIESLEHFFFGCMIIRNIWLQLFDELKLKDKFENIEVNLETILFGYKNENNNFLTGINTFIILVKYYIFHSKNENKNVTFEAAKYYLKHQCKINKMVTKNAEQEWAFLDQWLNLD